MNRNERKLKQKEIKPRKLDFNNQTNIESKTTVSTYKLEMYYKNGTDFSSSSKIIDPKPKQNQINEQSITNEASTPLMDTHNKENIDQSTSKKRGRKAKKPTVKKLWKEDLIQKINSKNHPIIDLFKVEEASTPQISSESEGSDSPNSSIYAGKQNSSKKSRKQTLKIINNDLTPKFNFTSLKTYTRTKKPIICGKKSKKNNNKPAEKESKNKDNEKVSQSKTLKSKSNFKIPKINRPLPSENQVSISETNSIFNSLKENH